ncbi:hypothetical protein UQ49_06440 [Salmonella enterica subsp. diarizonae]|uniref:Uncharacterized protein n=1 Tax=Salmonella diarizonae TaxID=59204 RepID=A0A2I5HJY5_SALDZ|nr:hypothetical protein UQ50_06435 [Salmonella enterica subsp. diarizonae]ANA24354.1 hypothetical protein UQ48_06435 [Salmonella enterica subsp. diarizonae]ANA28694.1 hypothetical protein UQ49_06440 [Salmonella enterica subsp. diarizonae]ATW55780.1 hypothetical protein CNQ75_15415 [Salmonella enterica subsp. diarizonae]
MLAHKRLLFIKLKLYGLLINGESNSAVELLYLHFIDIQESFEINIYNSVYKLINFIFITSKINSDKQIKFINGFIFKRKMPDGDTHVSYPAYSNVLCRPDKASAAIRHRRCDD